MPEKYDIFISYSHMDAVWVREQLYAEIVKTRTKEGRRPNVFMDTTPEGIQPGSSFFTALSEGIGNSRKFLPVYTGSYNESGYCEWEWQQCLMEDPLNKKKKLVGLLLEEESEARINPALKLLHYVRQSSPDWFVRLCAALELEREDARLEFMAEPEDTFINHGLSPIKVAIRRGDGIVNCEDEITMRDQLGFLQGETTVWAREGVAEFKSLSVSAECSGNCLIASSRGCEDRQGRAFSVRNKVIAEDLPKGAGKKALIERNGEALFFANGRALAVFGSGTLDAYRADGSRLLSGRPIETGGPFRIIRRLGDSIAFITWDGDLTVLNADGSSSRHQFRLPGRYMVPCGLSEEAGSLYAGFANGRIYRRKDSGEMRHYMTCKGSLQRMAAADGVLYVCDFEGNLTLYRDLQELKAFKVDRDVRAMEAAGPYVFIVGGENLFRLNRKTWELIPSRHGLEGVYHALFEGMHPYLVSESGKGFCFDSELNIIYGYHLKRESVPVSKDSEGEYCIFAHPDGTKTLMRAGRIVSTQAGGAFAVSEQADLFAVGMEHGISIVPADVLKKSGGIRG